MRDFNGGTMSTAREFVEQGNGHLKKLQFVEAGKCFQSALDTEANSIDARIGLARICIVRKQNRDRKSVV